MTTTTETGRTDRYEVAVVGGGPAGLTTALYSSRLGHDTVVFDRGGGRSAMMHNTHNVIGIPESVSGIEFLETAVDQLRSHDVDVRRAFVSALDRREDGFELETADGTAFAERVVLATGFTDERPDPPLPRTGRGLHYCLHCDAAMFVDEPVYVMGHDDSAASVAMIMLNVTPDVDLLLRGEDPAWSDETDELLSNHPVDVVHEDVVGVRNGADGWLEALVFADDGNHQHMDARAESGTDTRTGSGTDARSDSDDGTVREYAGGFAVYGSRYNNDLAASLGADLDEEGAVVVDDHGRTSVDGMYAVGDLTPGHNQVPIAMGQGAKAGIDIHTDLREFPKPPGTIGAADGVDPGDVPRIANEGD